MNPIPDPVAELRSVESATAGAQRSLEAAISHADASWSDEARRQFEAEHLAALRNDARHVRDELAAITSAVARANRLLDRR